MDTTLGPTAEAAFLDSVGMGPDCTFRLVELVDSDLRRMSGLVRQYADLRLGGTDASVVAICERLGIVTVATVNLRDFANFQARQRRRTPIPSACGRYDLAARLSADYPFRRLAAEYVTVTCGR
jgi:hypothetical protein